MSWIAGTSKSCCHTQGHAYTQLSGNLSLFYSKHLGFEEIKFLSCTRNLPSRWEPSHKCPLSWGAGGTQFSRVSHKSRVPMLHLRMGCTAGSQDHSAMPVSSHPCWLAPSSSWRRELPCSPRASRAWQPSRQQGLTRLSCDGIAYKPPPAPNRSLSQPLSGS